MSTVNYPKDSLTPLSSPYRTINLWTLAILLSMGLLLSTTSCSMRQVFSHYPNQMAAVLTTLDSPTPIQLEQTFLWNNTKQNQLLQQMEYGRMSLIQGKFAESRSFFAKAIALQNNQTWDSKIDISNSLQTGASLFSNSKVKNYRSNSYESTYTHLYQAVNYLFQKDLTAAGVEARRLNTVQKLALEDHAKEVIKAQESSKEQLNSKQFDSDSIEQQISATFPAVGVTKANFQNAYGFFISGLIFELRGDYNDAYIDYKKALELAPNNPAIEASVLKMSRASGLNYSNIQALNSAASSPTANQTGKADLIILFEKGLVPAKKAQTVAIVDLNHKALSISLPTYQQVSSQSEPLSASINSATPLRTEVINTTVDLARKDLQDKYLSIVTQQLLRVAAKNEMRQQLKRETGALGGLLADIYNVVSEQADLRSWLSLPNTSQALRTQLSPGQHVLNLRSGSSQKQITLNLPTGSTTILQVIQPNSTFHINQATF